jgi:hypothetical protein
VVNGQQEAINPSKVGTKAAAHYQVTVGPGKENVIRLPFSISAFNLGLTR